MQSMPSRDWEGGTYSCVKTFYFSLCIAATWSLLHAPLFTSLTNTHHISMEFSSSRKKQKRSFGGGNCVSSPVRPCAELSPAPRVSRHVHLAICPGAEGCFPASDYASVSSRCLLPLRSAQQMWGWSFKCSALSARCVMACVGRGALHHITKAKLQNRPFFEAGMQRSAAIWNVWQCQLIWHQISTHKVLIEKLIHVHWFPKSPGKQMN